VRRSPRKEVEVFGVSFLDVLANTIGGLSFILIMAFLLVRPPEPEKPTETPEKKPLTILTREIPVYHAGDEIDFALSATGGVPPYSWTVSKGELPPGLSCGPEGRLSGRPESAGQWHWAAQVEDGDGKQVATSLMKQDVLTKKSTLPIEITTRGIPTLLKGENSGVALAVTGGWGPYRWEVEPQLPKGLQLVGNQLVGAPEETWEETHEFTVTDSLGQSSAVSLPLQVRSMSRTLYLVVGLLLAALALGVLAWLVWRLLRRKEQPEEEEPVEEEPVEEEPVAAEPLVILTRSLPNARASFPYEIQLACLGGKPPYRWSLSDGVLPPGLELTPEGLVEGIPYKGVAVGETAEHPFMVEVEDSEGSKAQQEL